VNRYPLALERPTDPKILRRFFEKVSQNGTSCWTWKGYINGSGYGHFRMSGQIHYAHRVSYALFNNGLPDGLTVDHQCGNSKCVNPAHLQGVSIEENRERGVGVLKDVETGDLNYPVGDVPF